MGATSDQQNATCTHPAVKLHKCVSILPNDYNILENLPKINGVTLLGDQKAKALSLLSSEAEEYERVSLEQAKKDGGYLLLVQEGGEPKRMSLEQIKTVEETGLGFRTLEEVDFSAAIGSYQFIEKK